MRKSHNSNDNLKCNNNSNTNKNLTKESQISQKISNNKMIKLFRISIITINKSLKKTMIMSLRQIIYHINNNNMKTNQHNSKNNPRLQLQKNLSKRKNKFNKKHKNKLNLHHKINNNNKLDKKLPLLIKNSKFTIF